LRERAARNGSRRLQTAERAARSQQRARPSRTDQAPTRRVLNSGGGGV
jgi:hypothetical protein